MAAVQGLGAGLPLHRGPSLPARPVSSTSKHAAASRAGRAGAQSQQDGLAGNKKGSSPHSIIRPAGSPSGLPATLACEGASGAKSQPGGQIGCGQCRDHLGLVGMATGHLMKI